MNFWSHVNIHRRLYSHLYLAVHPPATKPARVSIFDRFANILAYRYPCVRIYEAVWILTCPNHTNHDICLYLGFIEHNPNFHLSFHISSLTFVTQWKRIVMDSPITRLCHANESFCSACMSVYISYPSVHVSNINHLLLANSSHITKNPTAHVLYMPPRLGTMEIQ